MTSERDASVLLAELVLACVQGHAGGVGVIVRDVLAPEPGTLLAGLKAMHEAGEPDVRIAYLSPDAARAAADVGLDDETFSTEVEQAERWRNQRNLTALIVVVAAGDEAKLTSLEEFGAITSTELKRALVNRAVSGAAGENEVQGLWWGMLAEDVSVGLGQLVDYHLALEGLEGADYKRASSRELHRLGLLPDPAFFDNPRGPALRRRLQANRDLVVRLQTLTPRDRRTIKQVVEGETEPERRAQLEQALGQLHRTRWEGEGMAAIDFEAAERLIKARTRKPASTTEKPKPRKATERAVEVAASSLVDPGRGADLVEVLSGLLDDLGSDGDGTLRTEQVRTPLSSGATEVTTTVRFDIVNLMTKMLDDGRYGGLLRSESEEINAILKRFNAEEDVIARWERERIAEVLGRLAETGEAGAEIAAAFDVYDAARSTVLPYVRALIAEPLVVAADRRARRAMLGAIGAYERLADGLWQRHDELFDLIGPDVDELLATILLLDLVVVQAGSDGNRTLALLSPVHPLFMWHYATYAEVVEAQRDRLPERDRTLIATASTHLPNFLTSVYVPATVLGAGTSLTAVGRLNAVPYYAKDVDTNASDDGIVSIERLIEAYVSLEPHARLGFRLALVDPPSVGPYLRSIVDFKDRGALDGAHVVAFRRHSSASVELRLDEGDEDRVAQVFRALNVDRRFTFEVREIPEAAVGPADDEPFHLAVVFDRGSGRAAHARPVTHPIQPLAMPRRLQYSRFHQTVELEPGSGGLFESYNKVVGRVSEGGKSSYLAVHQDGNLREALGALMGSVSWVTVADRQVDRDLALGALRVFTGDDGDRDIAGFAASTAAFRRPLRTVARGYNTHIQDAELDDLLAQLSDLLDEGLLHLRPDHTGKTNHNRVKGLLGTLIAARWFRDGGDAGNRLLISLDSAEARRWMHLGDDPLRADLVGIEWADDDRCDVSVLEVKTVDLPGREYRVEEATATGSAVEQMLATRRLLAAVLSNDREHELITTPARREVVREHLYRELTKGTYSARERELWADRLQRLLDGEVAAQVRCHLVDVRLGVDADSLRRRRVTAVDGDELVGMTITELNELLIDQLRQAEPLQEEEHGDGDEPPESGPDAPKAAPDAAASEPSRPGPATSGDEPAERVVEALPRALEAADEVSRPRALLGMAPGQYGKPREVWFDPALPEDPLPNPHISITGETGSGKTQAAKALLTDLQGQGLPSLILDFKDDYSEEAYAEAEGLRVYDAGYSALPFNPLAPPIDRKGRFNPAHHIHQLAEIVKRIYRLGDQQAFRLREAIKAAYESAGIAVAPAVARPNLRFPPFEAINAQLAEDRANEALLGRLSPIFDLGLFAAEGDEDLDAFLGSNAVVRLAQLPGDETKNAVAEFFLMALYSFLVRQEHTHRLGRLLILDEAWRLVESPFMIPLMREGRAFGLGVVVATQFPRDLPEAVRGSTATRLYFSQGQVEQIREIQRTVVGKTSGSEAEHVAGAMRGLSPLTCLLHSKQYEQVVRVTIKPYFERLAERMPPEDET